jgi:biotin operon repressor
MKKLDKCYSIVLQSSAKGISAVEVARKLNIHRTTVYHYLNSLELMGKVESKNGLWYAIIGEQTSRPLEREIEIELPMPKNQLQPVMALEMLAQHSEEKGFQGLANDYKIMLETLRETRTIKIKGKNVDDLDLEKLGSLIQQANRKSSRVDLKGLFKGLKVQLPSRTKTKLEVPNQRTVPNEHS